ncbi:SUKH-3 domain-containing protein [Actinacidiphila rubida]|uniref:SUKH-3 domain-containing protein n=1 Tax=Actinacidiphila rubida TaxID=310780 RepID=UPI00159F29CF|nr:SUKH-3 domain-containing protein [Actinacidiphila rubida]
MSDEEWDRIRKDLRLGQRLEGRVSLVPHPGAIGFFVDLGLPIGGFVDVLLLAVEPERWPVVGTVADFEVWWADDRPQLRLKPVDRSFLRDDFDQWLLKWRPSWPDEAGQPLPGRETAEETRARIEAWVDATATPMREPAESVDFSARTEESLRAAGWWPGRQVATDVWRATLEESGHVRMHEAAERFLAEFGGLSMGSHVSFDLDAQCLASETDRFAEWGEEIGRSLFPIGELDEGRFFLAIDENSEIYLVETWVATFGPAQGALEKLVAGTPPTPVAEP